MKRLFPFCLIILSLLMTACGTNRSTPTQAPVVTATGKANLSTSKAGPTVTGATASAAPTIVPGPSPTVPPNPGAPDVADYTITVRLDPDSRQLAGREIITYHNKTDKPIPDLVFHLYLNAFKGPDTVFMKESGGQLRGEEFNPQNNGWINVNSIQLVDGTVLKLVPEEDGTLARAALPAPVAPGGQVAVEVTFQSKLPQVFARTGWALDEKGDLFFLVGQWFPKLGVWTDQGWNAHVFHGNAEFFADFGSYSVTITLPDNYVTGATGIPGESKKNGDGTQTVSYGASGVIDFAWVASPNLQSASQKTGNTEILYLYLPEHDWSKDRVLKAAADGVAKFSQWFGQYPYPRLTVVDVPEKGEGAGGMEYPTFFTAGAISGRDERIPPSGWMDFLEITTLHEVAHQWWQSMVATNEAEEPWLDEGFADYSTILYLIDTYGLDEKALDQGSFPPGYLERRRQTYLRDPGVPMEGKAWDFAWNDYVIATYAKPDMALMTLQRVLGKPAMLDILSTYFQQYQFGHPTTADFQKVAVAKNGQDLGWFFNGLVYQGETLNFAARSIQGDAITLDREGDLVVPTDILVTFTDGTQKTITWDGKETGDTQTFTFPKAVQSFDIDPQHKLVIDLNWKDNALAK